MGCLTDFGAELVHLVLKHCVVLSSVTVAAVQEVDLLQCILQPAVAAQIEASMPVAQSITSVQSHIGHVRQCWSEPAPMCVRCFVK